MAMKEMEAYRPGVNVDRLVSLAALIAFVKVQQANRGYIKRIENEGPDDLEKSKNLYKLNSSAFRNLGKKNIKSLNQNIKRSAFKRLR
jgi:cell division protein ZapA (FtsZ GTPase activity inhibitor)